AERRRLAVEVVLDVAQVLGARIGEGHAGADHARQHASAGLVRRLAQPCLGAALREVAGPRATALRPDGTDRLLDLAPGGQAVLRSPHGPACSVVPEDVP